MFVFIGFPRKKVLFFHRFGKIDIGDNRVVYRDMYFFQNGILNIGDCVHTCIMEPFSEKKINYLEKGNGAIFNYRNQKMRLSHVWKRLFIDYYKCFFSHSTGRH